MWHTTIFIAQAQQNYEQTEYLAAIALTIAMIVLGLVAVCVPRLRKKHFVEPEEREESAGNRKKR